MPKGLKRYYGTGDLHFITCSCYRRSPWLDTPERRDLFLTILEQTRARYRFAVLAYVVMPEHFHLLMCEPQVGDPSTVIQVLKQRFAQQVLPSMDREDENKPRLCEPAPRHVWQARFYDFNIWTERKRVEKIRYMHRNPVERGLVSEPQQWPWSSFRYYVRGEPGPVRINDASVMQMRMGTITAFGDHPPPAKERKEGGTRRD